MLQNQRNRTLIIVGGMQALMAGLDGVLRELMAQQGTTPPEPPVGGAEQGACTLFPGLLTEPAMTAHVLQALDTAYLQNIQGSTAAIDERGFLTEEPEGLSGPSPSAVLPSLSRCQVSSPSQIRCEQMRWA